MFFVLWLFIDYIEKLINPIHLYKFTKKSISDLGKFGDNFKKSFHKNSYPGVKKSSQNPKKNYDDLEVKKAE